MMNFCPYCGGRMKSLPMLYETSVVTGFGVVATTSDWGAGIMQQLHNTVGHACRPPSISAQDFPFLVLAIIALGCGAIAFLVNIAVMIALLAAGAVFLALYIKIPKYSRAALLRYERWARLSICENCGIVGNENKEVMRYADVQNYLRNK